MRQHNIWHVYSPNLYTYGYRYMSGLKISSGNGINYKQIHYNN